MAWNRREFMAGVGGAGVAERVLRSPGAKLAQQAAQAIATVAGAYPADRYTPFGYLDNPYHSWDLHRSGNIRSIPAIGFGFYYPAGPDGYFDYGHEAVYEAGMRIGFEIGGKLLLEPADFGAGQLYASHHTHNLFGFEFQQQSVAAALSFFLADEHTLAARIDLRNHGAAAAAVEAQAHVHLQLGQAGWWGRDGLTGEYRPEDKEAVIRSFAAGPVFVLGSDATPNSGWMGSSPAYFPHPLSGGLGRQMHVAPGGRATLWFWLTRGDYLAAARSAQGQARRRSAATLAERRSSDDAFWTQAPRLEGDWPEHWRRGWVYDFETLRMMVRRPLGLYHHAWDAMQIQAPRNVLAETSLDMWTLSYADPGAARAVLLGQFLDALLPNVPCAREDGVMNMVAADGSPCGTSIGWCYPFFCIASVAAREPDRAWMAELYPKLAQFVHWTLANRTDKAGYAVGKCSWETGMDSGRRFLIQQPTGAETIEFIRIVELQAATAHAARMLAGWARQLQRPAAEAATWNRIAARFDTNTQALWNGHDWFQDFDTRNARTIVPPPDTAKLLGREVGQSAPIFLGVATPAQAAAMVPYLRRYRATPGYYLEWPSLVLPYLESLWTAGERALAAEVVGDIADRIYRSTDRRSPQADGGWPGVSREMWGLNGAQGGEGYGWGATLPAHIIRSLVGFRETAAGEAELTPNLPEALAVAGKRYVIHNLGWHGRRLQLTYSVHAGGAIAIEGVWSDGVRFHHTLANHASVKLTA